MYWYFVILLGVGYLDDVIFESASIQPGNFPATWVEQCSCPEGYAGLSCELCAPGYRREPLGNSPYSRCVKCFCHNHADTCDPDTGKQMYFVKKWKMHR